MTRALALLCLLPALGCITRTPVEDPDEPDGRVGRDAALDSGRVRDAQLPPDAPAPTDADALEDRPFYPEPPAAGAPCVVTLGEGPEAITCEISTRSMTACDELMRCACGALSEDVEACMAQSLIPRGAITLADYCAPSGLSPWGPPLSISDLIEEVSLDEGILLLPRPTRASAACEEVAAFSTWMEPGGFSISLLEAYAPVEPSSSLEGFALSRGVIALDEVEGYHAAEATLFLTPMGQVHLEEGGVEAHIGRPFLIHTDAVPIASGHWTSHARSVLEPGASIYIDELIRSGYYALQIYGEPPSQQPPEWDEWRAQRLAQAFAAEGKLLDAACISSCGCAGAWGCREGRCEPLEEGCRSDADCCQRRCGGGVCLSE